jgi:MtN3 and saliva related transmembrane protein
MYNDIIGYIAGTGTTISFLPQVYQVVRYKNTENISKCMFCIHTSGVMLWVFYGILIKNYVVIAFNAVSSVFCLTILGYLFLVKK